MLCRLLLPAPQTTGAHMIDMSIYNSILMNYLPDILRLQAMNASGREDVYQLQSSSGGLYVCSWPLRELSGSELNARFISAIRQEAEPSLPDPLTFEFDPKRYSKQPETYIGLYFAQKSASDLKRTLGIGNV